MKHVIYYTFVLNESGDKGLRIRRIEREEDGSRIELDSFISSYMNKINVQEFGCEFLYSGQEEVLDVYRIVRLEMFYAENLIVVVMKFSHVLKCIIIQ